MGCLSQIKQQNPKKGMTDFIKITAQYNFNRTKTTAHVQITRNKIIRATAPFTMSKNNTIFVSEYTVSFSTSFTGMSYQCFHKHS